MVSETAFPTFRLASDEAVFPDRFPLILEPSSQPVLADLTPQTQLALALRDQQAATINRGGIGVELVGDTSVTLFTWYRFIVLTATVALFLYLREIVGFSTRAVALRALDLAIESTRRR